MTAFDRLEKQLVAALQRSLETRKAVVVPEAGRRLWRAFIDLAGTRTYHMAGPNPISFAEIEAYARLYRWPLEPRHIAILRAMDATWLAHSVTSRTRGEGKQAMPKSSNQPMTAALFDAVFG